MIKDNNHIELDIFKKKFIQNTHINYDKMRLLNWNFILRNLSQLKTDSFIYLFIDNGRDILNSDSKRSLKNIIKNACNEYSTIPEKLYKIKFLSEHQKPLKWYSREITSKSFENKFGVKMNLINEINNISKILNYHFNILDTYIKTKDDLVIEIIFLIEENFISSKI